VTITLFDEEFAMLDLTHAAAIVESALQHARAKGLKPITVAVLDGSGALIALKREDGASFLRPQIAHAKAWGAVGMGVGTRGLSQRAATHPAFTTALAALFDGKVVPVPGGVLVRSSNNTVVGAVGISGDHADHDEACAIVAIEAAGFIADTGDGSAAGSESLNH
jgi:uncharacterized protein GlcG (DUF336 family)